nr:hypothetical protein [Microbacterium sp. SLBN-154]
MARFLTHWHRFTPPRHREFLDQIEKPVIVDQDNRDVAASVVRHEGKIPGFSWPGRKCQQLYMAGQRTRIDAIDVRQSSRPTLAVFDSPRLDRAGSILVHRYGHTFEDGQVGDVRGLRARDYLPPVGTTPYERYAARG